MRSRHRMEARPDRLPVGVREDDSHVARHDLATPPSSALAGLISDRLRLGVLILQFQQVRSPARPPTSRAPWASRPRLRLPPVMKQYSTRSAARWDAIAIRPRYASRARSVPHRRTRNAHMARSRCTARTATGGVALMDYQQFRVIPASPQPERSSSGGRAPDICRGGKVILG